MAHIHELIDYTAEVFIVHHDKVLFRLHDKYKIWLGVGGHIELHEDPTQAAVREVKEEVGLDIRLYDALRPPLASNERYQELIPPMFMNIHKIDETHRHIALIYFATADSDQVIESSHDRSGQWRWLSAEEVEGAEDILAPLKHYALEALRLLARK